MIYLNNSATSFPKPDCVVQAVKNSLLSPPFDPGRSSMRGEDVTAVCRSAVAELLGVRSERVFFSSGATESFNMLLRGLDLAGKKICISCYEHNALVKPLYALAGQDNIQVLTPDDESKISLEAWDAAIRNADYVFVNHCSNVTGQVQDIRAIAELCHAHAALCICDLSQSAGIIPLNIGEWGLDAAVFTGHKALFGPTGTGGFYLRDGLELKCPKWGGTGRNGGSVFPTELEPGQYEVGTQNLNGLAGLAAGTKFVLDCGVENILKKVRGDSQRLITALSGLDGVQLYTPAAESNIVSFNFSGLLPADTAYILSNLYDIVIRAGYHCAPLLAGLIGEGSGCVRVSVSLLTPGEYIDAFIDAVREISRSQR